MPDTMPLNPAFWVAKDTIIIQKPNLIRDNKNCQSYVKIFRIDKNFIFDSIKNKES
jgi:hypothetical protein